MAAHAVENLGHPGKPATKDMFIALAPKPECLLGLEGFVSLAQEIHLNTSSLNPASSAGEIRLNFSDLESSVENNPAL